MSAAPGREGLAQTSPPATRADGFAAWLVLAAPGMLMTRTVAALAFTIGAALSIMMGNASDAIIGVAVFLAVHGLVTVWIVRRPGRAAIALCGVALLADAAIAWWLLTSGPEWRGPAIAVAVVAVGISFEAMGVWGMLLSGAIVAGILVSMGRSAGTPPAAVARTFEPVLSVERSFGGVPVPSVAAAPFSTALSVETRFAGAAVEHVVARSASTLLNVDRGFSGVTPPDLAPATWSSLDVGSLLVAFVALIAGNLLSLVRARRTRTAVATAMFAAGRLAR